jgi:hypothetical protein
MKSIYETTNGSTMGFVNHSEAYYLIQLIGSVSRPHYQAVFNAVLEDSESSGYQRIILNIRDLRTNPDIGRTWLTSQFIPKFYRQNEGLQLAVVNPTNLIERKSIPLFFTLVKALGFDIKIKIFEKLAEARDWLNALNETGNDWADDDYEEEVSEHDTEKLISFQGKGSRKSLKIGKGKFKFKLHFDQKGRFDPQNPLENLLPKIKLSPQAIKTYLKDLKLF